MILIMPNFLALPDLCERWNYTKSGVHKLVKRDDFPKPFAIVNRGKMRIYAEETIVDYERDKPWLFDENQKFRRQILYLKLRQVKEAEPKDQQKLLAKLFGSA